MEAIDICARDMVYHLGCAFGGASQAGPVILGHAVAGKLNNGGWALIAAPQACFQAAFAAWEGDGEWEEEGAREKALDLARQGLVEALAGFNLTLGQLEARWQELKARQAEQLLMLQEEELEAGW